MMVRRRADYHARRIGPTPQSRPFVAPQRPVGASPFPESLDEFLSLAQGYSFCDGAPDPPSPTPLAHRAVLDDFYEYGRAYAQLDRIPAGSHWASPEIGDFEVDGSDADFDRVLQQPNCTRMWYLVAMTEGTLVRTSYQVDVDRLLLPYSRVLANPSSRYTPRPDGEPRRTPKPTIVVTGDTGDSASASTTTTPTATGTTTTTGPPAAGAGTSVTATELALPTPSSQGDLKPVTARPKPKTVAEWEERAAANTFPASKRRSDEDDDDDDEEDDEDDEDWGAAGNGNEPEQEQGADADVGASTDAGVVDTDTAAAAAASAGTEATGTTDAGNGNEPADADTQRPLQIDATSDT
ncbi:MAG: hypothetical protein FD144_5908, partial [Rhodospirillaceae bacterium]